MGFWQAGFQPVGFDINPRRLLRYPFPHFVADLTLLEPDELVTRTNRALQEAGGAGTRRGQTLTPLIAVASPPCPAYSVTRHAQTNPNQNTPAPKLIRTARMLFQQAQLTYVIENVEDARRYLIEPIRLCGSAFPFRLRVRRHRLFRGITRNPTPGYAV